MKIGFIGAGSMGGLLLQSFLQAGAFSPQDAAVSTRTPSRAFAIAERFPGLKVLADNRDTARQADVLFLCVKPMDYRDVLAEIAPVLRPEQIVVSITSPVRLQQLEARLPAKIVKMIPSIVNAARSGALLVMFGSRLTPEEQDRMSGLFAAIGRPIIIDEEVVRVASDLSSCGPAFMSLLLERFVEAAVATSGIDPELAGQLASEMLLGTSRLLCEHGLTPRELQSRVSVPGGITALALEELRQSTGDMFSRVLQTTHRKFAEDLVKVDRALVGGEQANRTPT